MPSEHADTNGRTDLVGTEPVDGSVDGDFDAPSVLELDGVFTALSHARRRYLLYLLVNGRGEAVASSLAAEVASLERDKPVGEVSDDERSEVLTALHHSHLPKLADLDLIEYERDENVVRAENTERVRAVLDGAVAELTAREQRPYA